MEATDRRGWTAKTRQRRGYREENVRCASLPLLRSFEPCHYGPNGPWGSGAVRMGSDCIGLAGYASSRSAGWTQLSGSLVAVMVVARSECDAVSHFESSIPQIMESSQAVSRKRQRSEEMGRTSCYCLAPVHTLWCLCRKSSLTSASSLETPAPPANTLNERQTKPAPTNL